MIGNLRVTTERNTRADWLKTTVAKFSRMMQGPAATRDRGEAAAVGARSAGQCATGRRIRHGRCGHASALKELASYADEPCRHSGSCAATVSARGWWDNRRGSRNACCLTDIPPEVHPGPRRSVERAPKTVIVLPVLYEGHVRRSSSWASLGDFTASHSGLSGAAHGVASSAWCSTPSRRPCRTEGLPQAIATAGRGAAGAETELQQTNEELANKAKLLAEQNAEVERQEPGDRALPAVPWRQKAAELALNVALQVGVPGQHVARAALRRSTASSFSVSSSRRMRTKPLPPAGGIRARPSTAQAPISST